LCIYFITFSLCKVNAINDILKEITRFFVVTLVGKLFHFIRMFYCTPFLFETKIAYQKSKFSAIFVKKKKLEYALFLAYFQSSSILLLNRP